jgi:hypothetical protein
MGKEPAGSAEEMIAFNVRQEATWLALTWIKVDCHPS